MHQDADELTIKKAYRALAKRRHIDERHGQRRPWDPVPTRKSYGVPLIPTRNVVWGFFTSPPQGETTFLFLAV